MKESIYNITVSDTPSAGWKTKDHIQFPYRCKDCKYLPICFGGCVDKNDCNRSLFEIMVPALLKVYIVRA